MFDFQINGTGFSVKKTFLKKGQKFYRWPSNKKICNLCNFVFIFSTLCNFVYIFSTLCIFLFIFSTFCNFLFIFFNILCNFLFILVYVICIYF